MMFAKKVILDEDDIRNALGDYIENYAPGVRKKDVTDYRIKFVDDKPIVEVELAFEQI